MFDKFSRSCLQAAVALGGGCLIMLGILVWPWSGLILIAVSVLRYMRPAPTHLTTLGSARWSEETELAEAGMLTANTGLILGRMPVEQGLLPAIRRLLDRRNDSTTACEQFWNSFRRYPGRMVRLPHAIHTAIFSPSGGGKGVSLAIPFLLTNRESCVSVDFKGELSQRTARHRQEQFHHRVIRLDPFRVVTNSPDTFNPLDFIAADHPDALDACNALAKALVVRTLEEKEPHWNDSAEFVIAAVIATVVRYGDAKDTRSLQTVRDVLCHPQRLDTAIKLMCESDAYQGMLARMGGQMLNFVEREKASVLTTASRHLRFLDTPAIAASTQASSFDPAELLSGRLSVFLTLPPEQMRVQSAMLRMWLGSLMRAVVGGGLQETRKVHFVLDEAASLGQLDVVDDALDKYRGYGIRLQLYYQSLGQLKRVFPNGQDQTVLSNTTQIYFGVNDTATAEMVSTRLGESTIVVESGGNSSSYSSQSSEGTQPHTSYSSSSSSNHNWQLQARKLLKPEEVLTLPPRLAITFTPGLLPIWTHLVRYYEEPWLGREPPKWRRGIASLRNCLTAFVLFVTTMFCTTIVAFALLQSLWLSHLVPSR